MPQNPYEILGVPVDAEKEDIKKAFRTLSKKHHPDAGGDPEEFKKISEAYDTLMNDEERLHYDQFGFTADSEEGKHMVIVMNSLCTVFDKMCAAMTPQELEKYDLIGTMSGAIRGQIQDAETVLEEIKSTLQKIDKLKEVLTRRLKRRASKKDTPNFFLSTLERRALIIKKAIKAHEYQLQVAKDMFNVINEYDFEFENFIKFSGYIGNGHYTGAPQ